MFGKCNCSTKGVSKPPREDSDMASLGKSIMVQMQKLPEEHDVGVITEIQRLIGEKCHATNTFNLYEVPVYVIPLEHSSVFDLLIVNHILVLSGT
jgi:hypothetical protein